MASTPNFDKLLAFIERLPAADVRTPRPVDDESQWEIEDDEHDGDEDESE